MRSHLLGRWQKSQEVKAGPGRYDVGMETMQRNTGWEIKAKLEQTSAISCQEWRKARVTNSWTMSHNIGNYKTLQLPSPGW